MSSSRTWRQLKHEGRLLGSRVGFVLRDSVTGGRVLLRPISTQAIVFFYLGQFYFGQVRLGPIYSVQI